MDENNDMVEDAEFKASPQEPTPIPEVTELGAASGGEANQPMVNGQPVEKVRFLDYGEIRVVFDAGSGAVLGTVPAKKPRKLNAKAS